MSVSVPRMLVVLALGGISCGSSNNHPAAADASSDGSSEASTGNGDSGPSAEGAAATDASIDTTTGAPVDAATDAAVDTAAGDDAAADSIAGGSSDSSDDPAADVDNGAPSTTYPAPHPALPSLINQAGGPVLTAPHVYLVFYPGYPFEADLQSFAQKMVASAYWAAATGEYGVGPFAYASTIELTEQTAPNTITNTDLRTWMGQQIASGALGTPDPQGIYTLVAPQGMTVTEPNPVSPLLPNVQSCVAYTGYHDSVAVAVGDAGSLSNFAYAVIPTCTASVASLTGVISHEWIEASTDPFVTTNGGLQLTGGPQSAYFSVDADHTIWALLLGGEAGDLCEPEGADVYTVPADLGYTVQRTWSNVASTASHDPCIPNLSGAFFDSAPVLPDSVTVTSPLITGTVITKGITIPVGQSKTIEVDLFSDGDTNGPWTVAATDALYARFGGYGIPNTLSFQWDRMQGVNGEKLHLTITVTQTSIVGNGHEFVITSTQGSRTASWPGLVVE